MLINNYSEIEINLSSSSLEMVEIDDAFEYKYPDLASAIGSILNAVYDGVARGQVLMPTGTGKTIVIVESARMLIEHSNINSFVMTGSTMALAEQHIETVQSFIDDADPNTRFAKTRMLLVYSGDYELNGSLQNVTTDPQVASNFIDGCKQDNVPYIIVSTYHSLQKVLGHVDVDVTYYDEAHNATNDQFKPTLDNGNFNSTYRFFLTATPRLTAEYDSKGKRISGSRTEGMDRTDLFGNTLYEMTPKHAIERKMIIQPKIAIATQSRGTVSFFNEKKLDSFSDKEKVELQREAALVKDALKTVYEQTGKVKAIVYARSVAHARALSENVSWSSQLQIPGVVPCFVCSKTSVKDRMYQKKRFIESDNAIYFNYRVLGEGINVEDVNSVVLLRTFDDTVSLSQAIGRSLRLDPTDRDNKENLSIDDPQGWIKPYGYVIIPETYGLSRQKEHLIDDFIEFSSKMYNIGYEDAKFVSKLPLTDEEKKRLKERMLAKNQHNKNETNSKYDIKYFDKLTAKQLLDMRNTIEFVDVIERPSKTESGGFEM